jgi:beta-galactosidase
LYSLLSFSAQGLGSALLAPYEYITGGLYTLSGGEIGNGNERGFSTSRDGESYAGFENLDFGSFGSDEITLDVFCLDSDPLEIRIWEGIPDGKDSHLLKVASYHKPSVWNTYQPETFLLEKRLSGVKTLSFQLSRKAHIKGFRFTRREKAFCTLFAGECDSISGDQFTRSSREISSIGNNVSIVFKNMDFGSNGVDKLTLSGRTTLTKNTIQIRFHSMPDDSDSIQLAEFSGTAGDEFITREFMLERVTGKQEVTFVFLPGSKFDFESFQFS